MPRRFAEDTDVPTDKSKAEIESLLRRYGATGFISGWDRDYAFIGFIMNNRQIRITLPLPDRTDEKFTRDNRGSPKSFKALSIDRQHEKWEQACRQSWRALALVIKAKLEAIEAGISIFEDEFLAHIVLPGGITVADAIKENIAIAYDRKKIQPLLPDYSK